MPEYLAPGVFIEETSYRSKSIEGVSTSTAGFIGPTRTGPISGHPELLTSFGDFALYYGGLDDLDFDGTLTPNYLAHGVRAFFEEGGKRCYVVRVFEKKDDSTGQASAEVYSADDGDVKQTLSIKARFPGKQGNMRVALTLRKKDNVFNYKVDAANNKGTGALSRVADGDLVYVGLYPKAIKGSPDPIPASLKIGLYEVRLDAEKKNYILTDDDGTTEHKLDELITVSNGKITKLNQVYPLSVLVSFERRMPDGKFGPSDFVGEFKFGSNGLDALLNAFGTHPSTRFAALTNPFYIETEDVTVVDGDDQFSHRDVSAVELAKELFNREKDDAAVPPVAKVDIEEELAKVPQAGKQPDPIVRNIILDKGDDGNVPTAPTFEGNQDLDSFIDPTAPDDFTKLKNGLLAFEAVDDISIVAAPGHTAGEDPEDSFAIARTLISHCEKMMYRVAVLDTPQYYLPTEALAYRNLTSSKFAAIYYPWIYVADPRPGQGSNKLKLPPSGFVAGIYARNDIQHAVFKAPANEVVRLAVDFEQHLAKAHQELLNPEGVNCFRFFEGRGFLLWGARTISDDPEWKYVNVRRYFAYLEHSIDKGTQWAVFENNNIPLWNNVRQTIEDFLYNEWRMGGLMGAKPEQGYFVRCDRSTMTQNDLDNGRLVCLIGIAPVKPAEFVIFRIGQWTADSPIPA